ncbi:MAG: hypothetical protein CMN71_03350 [Sphingomonadaceae bacterium]|nr:hypothetical protein [Sphingomonadaceae bacterium]
MLQLPKHISDKVRQSVLITGSARSGTSIFGKLIGSLESVEYFFEPPTLFSLFALLNDLPASQARFLFDTFLYEELLIGAISGRTINLRGQDDSSIRHTKTEAEIARRLEASARKGEMETESAVIAVKVPDFVYRLPAIADQLGVQRLLVSVRDPGSTINSLVRRRWFTDASLQSGDITWPNRFRTRVPSPHWVPADWLSAWDDLSEVDRAALYYVTQTDLPEDLPGETLVFGYDQLLAQPRNLLRAVAERLGLDFGPRTETLLANVGVQESTAQFDLGQVRSDLRVQIRAAYDRAASHCLTL